MAKESMFNEIKEKYLTILEQYVPVVARVHGKTHPEFYEVHKIFDVINAEIQKAESRGPELAEAFASLRKITNDYTVPQDVCESYEAVYTMLAKLDKAYYA